MLPAACGGLPPEADKRDAAKNKERDQIRQKSTKPTSYTL
jgi:hypothetical protein